MIRNSHILEQFELEYERENPLTLEQKFDLFEAMYEQAKHFGYFAAGQIEDDYTGAVALARILNEQVQPTVGENRPSA
jgi:hypothetical protein